MMPPPPPDRASASTALSSNTAGVIFSELNPIVQALLASLQSSGRDGGGGGDENSERILKTLRIRSTMIRRLMAAIESVSRVQWGPEALVAMAEFVLLSLILILQGGVDARSGGMQTRPSAQSGRDGVGPTPSPSPSSNHYLLRRSPKCDV